MKTQPFLSRFEEFFAKIVGRVGEGITVIGMAADIVAARRQMNQDRCETAVLWSSDSAVGSNKLDPNDKKMWPRRLTNDALPGKI